MTGVVLRQKVRSPIGEFWRHFQRQKVAVVAALVLLVLCLVAVFAPWVAPFDPTAADYANILAGPSADHWAGTDAFGRDVFSRILFGARISLAVGFLSVSLGSTAGILLGLVSGFHGGWVDSLAMRFCDVLLAFPGILLAIAVPFGLAVVAGVGGGLAVTGAAILTIAVVLVVMTRALSRVMGD